ncbi:MAG: hypothetical protein K8R21_11175 [Leptospira sp.]|nr:hypothetical protein [Leptospira sp.]
MAKPLLKISIWAIIPIFSVIGCIPSLNQNPLEILSILRIFNTPAERTFTVGGAVSGLVFGSSVSLVNGSETLTISADGNFTFSTKIKTGAGFEVTSSVLPSVSGLTCSVSNGKGIIQTSNISNITVTCGYGPGYYSVGLNVTGLAGTLTVLNNSANSTGITSNGLTNLSFKVNTGNPYAVSIQTQPTGKYCNFEDISLSTGTMPGSTVILNINCVTGFAVSGNVQVAAISDLGTTYSQSSVYIATKAGGFPTNVGGPGVAPGLTNGVGGAARFNNPRGLTTDGTSVYIAEYINNTIRKYDIATGAVTTIAGGNTGGGVACPGTFQAACKDGIGTAAQFNSVYGLTTDGTNLYVIDIGNNRIRKILISTGQVTTIAGDGNAGGFLDSATGLTASFNSPQTLVLVNNALYIIDYTNSRIRKMNLQTTAVTTIAGTGASSSIDNAVGTSATFNNPNNIVAVNGFLYVTDTSGSKIRKIDLTGTNPVTTIAGSGVAATVDGVGLTAQFNQPFGITSDNTNLFVSEATGAIRQIKLSNFAVTTIAGSGPGYADNATVNALFNNPGYLATDGLNIYVSDVTNHSLRRLESAIIAKYTLDGNANDSGGLYNGTNGTSDYISVPDNAALSPANITVSIWINPAQLPTGGAWVDLVDKRGAAGIGWQLFLQEAGGMTIRWQSAVSGTSQMANIPLNTWSHIAVAQNGNTATTYLNGQLINTTGAITAVTNDASKPLEFGTIQSIAVQVPSGLVAYYPMTGSANDVSGNGVNGTVTTASLIADRFGQANAAYLFNGATDFISAPGTTLPTGNASRTTCAWIKPANTAVGNIVSFGSAAASSGNGLAKNSVALLHYGFADDVANPHFNITDRWVHVCGTYDGATASLYLNGSFLASSAKTWNTTAATLFIGRRMDGVEFFPGSIDDVRVYNRLLSLNEIRALSGIHALQIPNMQLHLQADSLSGSPVNNWADNSPNNLTGGNSAADGNSVVAGTAPTWTLNGVPNIFSGKPYVTFNGATQFLQNITGTFSGLTGNDLTYFIVLRRQSAAGLQIATFIGPTVSGKKFFFDKPAVPDCPAASGFTLNEAPLVCKAQSTTGFSGTGAGTERLFSLVYDSSVILGTPFSWNNSPAEGTTIATGATFAPPTAIATSGIRIGSNTLGAQFFNGDIAEIIYYDRVLTTAEGDLVRCYLSAKYGIQIANICQ